jgi:hypothetical protein
VHVIARPAADSVVFARSFAPPCSTPPDLVAWSPLNFC